MTSEAQAVPQLTGRRFTVKAPTVKARPPDAQAMGKARARREAAAMERAWAVLSARPETTAETLARAAGVPLATARAQIEAHGALRRAGAYAPRTWAAAALARRGLRHG